MSYSFQKTYTLLPQSPLIHFQPNAKGVSLRSTEVKPKLDRFLKLRYERRNGKSVPAVWYVSSAKKQEEPAKKKAPALKYKISLEQIKVEKEVDLGSKTDYDIFYGNMVSKEEKEKPRSEPITPKRGLFIREKLTVTCLNKELLQWIDDNIGDFFIVTNFGTMQNKGFGSFIVQEKEEDIVQENGDVSASRIASALKEHYGAGHCYCFDSDEENTFVRIKTVYSLMKSGINMGKGKGKGSRNYIRSFLFDYMHSKLSPKKAIDNEKAWLKEQKIAPAVKKDGFNFVKKIKNGKEIEVKIPRFIPDPVKPASDTNYKYVRALFGIGESIRFNGVNQADGKSSTVNVSVEHDYGADKMKKEDRIARIPSPVFFKIVKGCVFFLGIPVNESVYGKTFSFSSIMGKMTLKSPGKSDLPDDFMDDFMDYCYGRLKDVIAHRTGTFIDKEGKTQYIERAFGCLDGMMLREEG